MAAAALLAAALSAGSASHAAAQQPDASAGAAAAARAASEDTTGAIGGRVRGRFQGGARQVGYAVVEATSDRVRRWVTADSLGFYRLDGLPAGELRLRATHPGHQALSLLVYVPRSGTLTVDLELHADPIRLPSLDVLGSREIAEPDAPGEGMPKAVLPEVELQALDVAPGVVQAGLVDAIGALPGNDPAEPTDVLFMRGSTTDLKLVLLDGVPIYTPFHVAGLLRSFEPTVLESAKLHVGGAPARYDGGLTHILDIRTRRARRDRLRASASVDLLSASAAIETPLGEDIGLLASVRGLHDVGSAALGGRRPYGYEDVLVALSGEPAPGHAIRATGFWNEESVLLDFNQASDDARWSNLAGTVGYAAAVGPANIEVTAGVSGYRATLPLQPSGRPGEPTPPALLASAGTDRVRWLAEASWGPAEAPVRLGVSYERIEAAYRARSSNLSTEIRAATTGMGAFLDVTRPLGPGVTLRAGIRGDYFSDGTLRPAPRAALLWEVGPQALLTVAAGRYHQPTHAPAAGAAVEQTLVEMVQADLPSDGPLPVATADHVVLSLDQRLTERVSLGLGGFWKRYEGLRGDAGETIRSSGVDVRVLSSGERVTGWLGYGLSWFWSSHDLSGRTTDFVGRHLLSAGVSGRLVGPLRAEARVAYGAGLPYTAVPFARQDEFLSPEPTLSSGGSHIPRDTPVVSGLEEEFLRIDVELQALFEPEWGGRELRVRPYLRILNALDQRDAMFYTFQPWRDDAVRPLAERSFLPLLGVAFSF